MPDAAAARRPEQTETATDLGFAASLRAAALDPAARKTERTRLRLLAAMAEALAAGADRRELKVADVTRAAGLSHGVFYRYFENMSAGVEALIETFAGFVHERLAGARSGGGETGSRERAREATLLYTRLFRANAALMRLLIGLGAESDAFASAYRALNAAWNARMAAAIARGRGEGASAEAMLPAAYALGGMVDEFLTALYLRREPALETLAEDEAAVADLLADLWLRGAYGRPPDDAAK